MPVSAQTPDEAEDEIVLIEPGDRDYIVVNGGVLSRPLSDRADASRYISRPEQDAGIRVENIIRDIPGWQQFRRSDARSANPTSQGLTARGLGGNAASRALLVLDGVPQSDPFGGWVNWTAFDAVRLRGMRIVPGGGSGTDGAGALAGTIQMSSRHGDYSMAALSVGSRDSVDADFDASLMAISYGSINLTGNYSRGDGFVPIVAGQRGVVDRRAGYESYGVGARFVSPSGYSIPIIEATIRAFDDKRSRGVPFSDSRNGGVDASIRLLDWLGEMPSLLLGYVQLREFSSQFGSVSADRATVTPTLDQFAVPATGYGARLEIRPDVGTYMKYSAQNDRQLRLGLDWRRNQGTTRENSNYVSGLPTRRREAGGTTETLGVFAEFAAVIDRIDIAGSLRGDTWAIRDGQRQEFNIGGGLRSDDRFPDRNGREWTGRVSANWWFADPIKLKVAAYRGWRLPTLNELYRPFRVGADATAANEALGVERLVGAEAKLESNVEGAELGVTVFTNRLDGAIANVTLGQGPGTFPGVGFVGAGGTYRQRQNLDAIISRGIELDGRVELADEWTAYFGYAYVDAKVRASLTALGLNGLRPAQVPKHSGSVSLGYDASDQSRSARFELRYIGRQFEDDGNLRSLKDALTAELRFTQKLRDKLFLTVRGENLFDARIETAISSGGIIERATPRTLWLGLNAFFE
jgi:hypothetical protein